MGSSSLKPRWTFRKVNSEYSHHIYNNLSHWHSFTDLWCPKKAKEHRLCSLQGIEWEEYGGNQPRLTRVQYLLPVVDKFCRQGQPFPLPIHPGRAGIVRR